MPTSLTNEREKERRIVDLEQSILKKNTVEEQPLN